MIAITLMLATLGAGQDVPVTRVGDARGCTLDFGEEVVLRVDAAPEWGFHHPYYLWIPATPTTELPLRLLVEPNNSGFTDDDPARHDERAARLARDSYATTLARRLGLPLLVPVFPRPRSHWRAYTHALDEDTLRCAEPGLERIDLQLLAMIEDVRGLFEANDLELAPDVFLDGFSASGTFGNRFAALHPRAVRAVASGGVNAIPILPAAEFAETALPYPVGLADLEELTGIAFDRDAYLAVSQLVYMGAHDRNDATLFDDAFEEPQRALVHELFGRDMPARWEAVRAAYAQLGVTRAQLVTYEATAHTIRPEMIDDLVRFFRANSGPEHRTIEAHAYPPEALVEPEDVRVNALHWRGAAALPEPFRELLEGRGSFFIGVEGWIAGQDHEQLTRLRERAGFQFRLEADGQESIEITAEHLLGTQSSGDGSFQGFVVRIDEERVGRAVDYVLTPTGAAGDRWHLPPALRLRRP